jgi:FixJ family two-component response regulator
MEPLSGLDLLRGTKTTENARTPFLLATGTYDAKFAVDAKAAGASWFILKPFSVDQMRRKLREMIQV